MAEQLQEQLVKVLDTNTANQIAAGEVVEKPASVVKELVENALDAGATQIEVTIFAGGTEYIRVVDNGCGMSEANARLAVLRHATSKLIKAEDLLSLHTLGFRGEALPSIASVSKFTLLTRPATSDFATSVKINGGEDLEVSNMGGNTGTTVIVEDLFFNVPARRKFLKTKSTEGRYISELLTKLALSRPNVRFKLIHNDKEVLSTPGDGELLSTVRALYGKNVSQELLKVELAGSEVQVTGFIGKPTLLKGTRAWQTFFINGRSVGSKMLAKAIDHAYQSQIPKSGFPFAVLNIELDTAAVDVNVHPQKSEVKFSDEGLIYRSVYKALTDALTRPMKAEQTPMQLLPDSELNVFVKGNTYTDNVQANPAQSASLANNNFVNKTGVTVSDTPVTNNASNEFRPNVFKGAEQIFKTPDLVEEKFPVSTVAAGLSDSFMQPQDSAAQPDIWQSADNKAEASALDSGKREPLMAVYEARSEFGGAPIASNAGVTSVVQNAKAEGDFANVAGGDVAKRETIAFTNTDSDLATIWPIGQVDKTFIIAQSEDTLYLIDQHAAHERILYDKLCATHEDIPAQQLLMPLYLNMDGDTIELLEQHHDEFIRLGVDASAAGDTMLRISSLPADLKAEDAEEFINEIAKMLREMRTEITGSDLRQEVLHMTACKAAIKAGQLLNMQQMRHLIIDLCNTTHPFTCPHGRPCMIAIDSDQLYKMFKRTGF